MMRSTPKIRAWTPISLIISGPLLLLLLSCPNEHLLRLTLTVRLTASLAAGLDVLEADPSRAARFTDGKQKREDPILEFRLDIVGIDRPGEGDRPFKRASDDFPREPVVSPSVAFLLAL